MNGTKCKLLFFAPVLRISRTDDRKKANIHERKRMAIVHAKFALAENTHYFAHFQHNGFGGALLARNYCAYNCMAFRASDNVYNCVILTRHYCDYNGMAFVARHTRYDAGHFVVSLLRIWLRGLYGALYRVWWRAFCRPTYALQARRFLWRVIRRIRQVVLTRCYSTFDRGIFRAIISIILIFTCNQVQFI